MPQDYAQNYIAVFILAAIAVVFAALAITASRLIGPKKPSVVKGQPYECGIESAGVPTERFAIRFYIIAMLFILFDVELIFFYPWAVAFNLMRPRTFLLVEMVVFIGILLIGYIFAWRKGALDWE